MKPLFLFFFFKQKTAYELRISDWSSDVCSSDLLKCIDFQKLFSEVSIREYARICPQVLTWCLREGRVRQGLGRWQRSPNGSSMRPRRAARITSSGTMNSQGLACVFSRDRKSVVSGKSGSVRVDFGGRRIIKKKKKEKV